MDNDELFYNVFGMFLFKEKNYKGWATERGWLLFARYDGKVKMLVSKRGDDDFSKYFKNKEIEILLYFRINKPYRIKSIINKELKFYKISKFNTYEYDINDEDLLKVLYKFSTEFSYPIMGKFAEKISAKKVQVNKEREKSKCNISVVKVE